MSDFGIFDGISDEPPVQEFLDYYSVIHEEVTVLPRPIQEFGVVLIALMDTKPVDDDKSVNYVKNFFNAFCVGSDNYNHLTQKGKETINELQNSDNKFLKYAISKVEC